MLEISIHSLESEINSLRSKGVIRHLLKAHEGINHWYSLYEVRDQSIKCAGGCPNTAKFLLFTHYHDNSTETVISCEDHCPEMYLDISERVHSG